MNSQTKFAFWDVDHTLIRGDSMLLFLRHGLRQNPGSAHRLIAAAWHSLCFKLGWISAEEAKKSFFYSIADCTEADLQAFYETRLRPRIYSDALGELRRLKREGYRIVLVSASPTAYLSCFTSLPEVDAVLGTELMRENGRFTPAIQGLNCKGEEKVSRINRYLQENGQSIDYERSCAYSDSLSDLPMFRLVRNRYLVRGSHPELEVRRWSR